jgi:2-oxo-4-hydroxy-4-carboxy-5-ureidoimidazoline decarboxylase
VTLADVNACDRRGFVDRIGWVFEHSPWVAERAWRMKPFATLNELHSAMTAQVAEASPDEQVALLCAHPDLGARAGLQILQTMSGASAREQAGAGLDSLTPTEFDQLHRLNAAYRDKFGFPFVYAVKGSTKHDILNALETRLSAGHQEELAEALRQVCRIARGRLEETIKERQ